MWNCNECLWNCDERLWNHNERFENNCFHYQQKLSAWFHFELWIILRCCFKHNLTGLQLYRPSKALRCFTDAAVSSGTHGVQSSVRKRSSCMHAGNETCLNTSDTWVIRAHKFMAKTMHWEKTIRSTSVVPRALRCRIAAVIPCPLVKTCKSFACLPWVTHSFAALSSPQVSQTQLSVYSPAGNLWIFW